MKITITAEAGEPLKVEQETDASVEQCDATDAPAQSCSLPQPNFLQVTLARDAAEYLTHRAAMLRLLFNNPDLGRWLDSARADENVSDPIALDFPYTTHSI